MHRRKFMILTATGLASTLIPYRESEAFFFGVLLRFFIRGVIRRSITRTIVSGGIRVGVGRAAGRAALSSAVRRSSMKAVSSLRLSAGLVIGVSPDIYAMAKEYDAEGIWVLDDYDNEFIGVMNNDSDKPVSGQLYYTVEDVESGRTEKEFYGGLVYSGPRDTFKFPFSISDLPYTGVKRIVGNTDNQNIKCESSGNIIVARSDEVIIKQ